LRYPGGEVDVVCCEVFDHTDVGNTRGERALATRADLKDLTQETFFELLPHRAESGVEAFNVADTSDETGGFERVDQLCGLDMRGSDRLLDERVYTRGSEFESE
jgi:hypothetical protein